MEDNIFTTKLYDVILPKGVIVDESDISKQRTGVNAPSNTNDEKDIEDVTINFKHLTHIFIVMEFVDTDF
jgi:hypothetical protein